MATFKQKINVNIQIDPETLRLLDCAKTYLAIDRNDFIRLSIREKAESIISAQEQTRFTTDDWGNFFALLDNPSEPTARMKKAKIVYKNICDLNSA
jgi:uncharacterized protein (DUF1778 family)